MQFITNENVAVQIDVLTNDYPFNGTLIIVNAQNGSHGITQIIDSMILYTPNINYCGKDNFKYIIKDIKNIYDQATVNITINCIKTTTTITTMTITNTISIIESLTTTITTSQNDIKNTDKLLLAGIKLDNTKWDKIGYTIIISTILISLLLLIFSILYHINKHGSDKPNYLSIFKCFLYISNLYTNIIFIIVLYIFKSNYYIIVFIILLLTHIIANIFGIYCIQKWKQLITQNNKFKCNELLYILSIFC